MSSRFVPDKDIHGQNIVLLLLTVLREMLNITTDVVSNTSKFTVLYLTLHLPSCTAYATARTYSLYIFLRQLISLV